jgi:hypothetical protein
MILGMQKRQWVILLLALFMPLLFNAVGIWHDVGKDNILQMLHGTYSYVPYDNNSLDLDHNPFPEIFINLLPTTIFLGATCLVNDFYFESGIFSKATIDSKTY